MLQLLKDGDKDYENLVTRVEYEWVGTSESGTKASLRYTKDLDLPGDDYIVFDDLVEANIKPWVSDTDERSIAITIIDKQIIVAEENKFQQTSAPWIVKIRASNNYLKMAVPFEGPISLRGISNEKEVNDLFFNLYKRIWCVVSLRDIIDGGNEAGSQVSYERTNVNSPEYPGHWAKTR